MALAISLVVAIQGFPKATRAVDEKSRREEDHLLSQRIQGLVQGAAELGTFDLFRQDT